MRVDKTYTVAEGGVGRPDYAPQVAVSKPILTSNQTHWSDLWTTQDDLGGRLDPGSLCVTMYTVPTGYRLHLGGGVVSCEASCIQNISLVCTPGIIGDFRYDMRGDIVFGVTAASIIDEGDALMFILYNNDTVARHFSVSLIGTLERIG
ncbi:hypothetical protein ES703_22312 [subsurface metagenome]